MKVRAGDMVRVMTGKDAGAQGRVFKILPKSNKLIVEGVNTAKRHTRPTRDTMQGGIIDKDMPIDISNVMIVCGSCDRPTRVGYRIDEDGAKSRVCRKCGKDL